MNEQDRRILERIAGSNERIAGLLEKQQPGKAAQIMTLIATAANRYKYYWYN